LALLEVLIQVVAKFFLLGFQDRRLIVIAIVVKGVLAL